MAVGSFTTLIRLLLVILVVAVCQRGAFARQADIGSQLYQQIEITLASDREYAHPYRSVDTWGAFAGPGGKTIRIRAFWKGGRIWALRFAPPDEGHWQFRTECSDASNTGLNDQNGTIEVGPYSGADPFAQKGWLRVSDSRRYLSYANGEPFFWTGDTAWEITWKSDREEMLNYLDDRQSKGFNVIQVVAMSHQQLEEFGVRNRQGEPFFLNQDYSLPNPRYFDYLDTLVSNANARGMAVALVPLWAGMNELYFDPRYQRFSLNEEQSLLLARYIAARYAGSNVIWIVAGDNKYDTPQRKTFWSKFALEIRQTDGNLHLMTVHPHGYGSSFDYFDNHTPWLDFQMYQSSHVAGGAYTYQAARRGYRLKPIKPVLNGEAVYEDIYDKLWAPGDTTHVETFRIRPEHIRQADYESILSGALVGMTYGGNGVWQWSTPENPGTHSPRYFVTEAWQMPGSREVGVLKNLMQTYSWYRFIPAHDFIAASSPAKTVVPVAVNKQYLMAYLPPGTFSCSIYTRRFAATASYRWINPATGETGPETSVVSGATPQVFYPPDERDWLLVMTRRTGLFEREEAVIADGFSLKNMPNPFNPSTRITFQITEPSQVSVEVFNLLGQRVRTLSDGYREEGVYVGQWDGKDDQGRDVSSGIYFCHLVTGERKAVVKMTLLR